MTKRFYKILTFVLSILPLISYFFSTFNHFFSYLSNSYFYMAAFCLIIGLFAHIIKVGTFDLFAFSLRKYLPKKRNDYAAEKLQDQSDDQDMQQLSKSVGSWYILLLKIGTYFLILSLVCLGLYFLTK